MTTLRRTTLYIINNSGHPISEVVVRHKYSNNYKDKGIWKAQLASGKSARLLDSEKANEAVIIRYNTGFLATGVDWWLATWKANDQQFITDPPNYRDVMDTLEDIILGGKSVAKALAAPSAGVAGILGGLAVDFVVDGVFNSEATYEKELGVGFKNYTLREGAEQQAVMLEIGPHDKNTNKGTVTFGLRSDNGDFDPDETTEYRALTEDDNKALKEIRRKVLEKAKQEIEAELKKLDNEIQKDKK